MSDIVEILRGMALTQADGNFLVEAADEIEDLRSKLDLMRRIAGKASVEGMTLSDIKKEIRSGKDAEG